MATTRRIDLPVDVEPARRLFTRAEYHRMGEAGVFAPSERVELIRGEILRMSPIGSRHVAFVNNLTELLVLRLAGRAIVSVQNPVALSDDTEPQPDLTVLRRRTAPAARPYKEREPWTEDALLVIEVAQTSLGFDRRVKSRLYAEFGIPEYWVVDTAAEAIEVHRAPGPEGYADVQRIAGAASIGLLAFPDVTLALADVFA